MDALKNMAILLAILAAGYGIGRVLQVGKRFPRLLAVAQNLCVWVLIFTMGIRLGADSRVMGSLPTLGWQAAVITVFALAGSIVLTLLVARMLDGSRTKL